MAVVLKTSLVEKTKEASSLVGVSFVAPKSGLIPVVPHHFI